ncbi:MAG: sigma-54-dependent Fis family transcriptional regulator [Candidatus Zixiibacteriota bacterium]
MKAEENQIPEHSDVERLRRALGELRLINSLIARISQVREVNHIMDLILGELVRATQADQGLINLVTPMAEGDALTTVVRTSKSKAETTPFKANELICGWVLTNRVLLKIDDLDHDERFSGMSSSNGLFKSVICCPMLVRNEIIGLTSLVRSAGKGPFTDEHCRLVGILTSQSAQLLSNARLLEELAAKNELLELSRQKLHDEYARLQSEVSATFAFEQIVGKSAPMKRVLALASKFSCTDSAVLIVGATGTGKELLARAIHYNSPRKDRPFIIKNCGIKTESLLESELFGHVRGAFTGADREKRGLFKEADGGTIFLDEIGDAPLSTQAAILRVIQSGEIRPLGSTKTEYVDVRVLSATNKNLKDEIARGNFRDDLYYRLNTFTLELPSLAERTEDIPLLINHFLKRLRIKLGVAELHISPGALERFLRYDWPGNVRQLEHELERAAVVCGSDGVIEVTDLSPVLAAPAFSGEQSNSYRGELRLVVERVEREMIAQTLKEHEGNIMQTAEALGLTRKGLKDKMDRYGIKR